MTQSRQNFARTSELYESKSATRPDYDSAKANLDVNQARVQQAKAQIAVNDATQRKLKAHEEESKLSLADTVLRSPMSGVITKRYVEVGSLLAQGAAVFRIADTSFVKVSFGVPDVGLVHLKLGDRVTIVSEALPGREFMGRITEIAPQADADSKVFSIGVMLPNPGNVLRLGMITSLKVNAEGKATKALTVPLNAVVRSSKNANGYAVFVVREQGGKSIAAERSVEIGQGYGRLLTVHGDIASGDKVVTIGNNRITNGQEVRISE
jgi:RND family efflux transporter MFP subunit